MCNQSYALSTSWHSPSCDFYMERFGDKDLNVIQQKVNSFVTPDNVGCVSSKIASSFSGFTAVQWRNWTLIFSLYSLYYNCLSKPVMLCAEGPSV